MHVPLDSFIDRDLKKISRFECRTLVTSVNFETKVLNLRALQYYPVI